MVYSMQDKLTNCCIMLKIWIICWTNAVCVLFFRFVLSFVFIILTISYRVFAQHITKGRWTYLFCQFWIFFLLWLFIIWRYYIVWDTPDKQMNHNKYLISQSGFQIHSFLGTDTYLSVFAYLQYMTTRYLNWEQVDSRYNRL